MLHNPYKIVKMFEEEMAHYTGAPYAVSVDSCTNAIFLCCKYLGVEEVTIPKRTYLSVPQSIIQAGGNVKFEDTKWEGAYQLKPYPVWDAAKRLTAKMYIPDSHMCLSFHIKKHLKIGKGGMILTAEQAARGLTLMQNYPSHVRDIPESPPYRDLTEFKLFGNNK